MSGSHIPGIRETSSGWSIQAPGSIRSPAVHCRTPSSGPPAVQAAPPDPAVQPQAVYRVGCGLRPHGFITAVSVPFPLRFLFARQPTVMGTVLGIVYCTIATYLTRHGKLRYELKIPDSDGTTHVMFEPLDFIAKLVALVPRPRVNLTRYHGVFAPNSKYRALVTPAKHKGKKIQAHDEKQDQTPAERRASMTWAKRLKRVFNIDIETCSECGGAVKIIASIEDPEVIRKILAHLDEKMPSVGTRLLPQCRAPPPTGLFEETHHLNDRLQRPLRHGVIHPGGRN